MEKPFLIAGPCAAESEEQIISTARFLSEKIENQGFFISYFRAGVWKPRSNPKTFKGVGEKAFPWLQRVEKEFGFKVCVEVATPEHVACCEKYGIKTVWIGSRTSVNPFIVEELANAMKKKDFTVMVKNPITPDLSLWKGAIERFLKKGISNVIAIHRGVSDSNENIFRNAPVWEMPIELKVAYPNIPLFCDISHIAGHRKYLRQIAQIALDLGFYGLMVETHVHPKTARSDAQQQITPEEFYQLLSELQFNHSPASPVENLLQKERNMIEHIDTQISMLLYKRLEIIDRIAQIKKENNIPIVNTNQFNKIKELYMQQFTDDPLLSDFIQQCLELLHYTSIQRQKRNNL